MTDTHAETAANGSRPAPVRTYSPAELITSMDPSEYPPVKFGKRDDDEMPHTWASRALTWLHENNPKVFGDMMLATMNVNAHTTTRAR